MWKLIAEYFENLPAEKKVARILFSYGLCIKHKKIYCGEIKISDTSLARATGVNRRAIRATVEVIEKNKELKQIFSKLLPISYLKDIAPFMKWGVLEIAVTDISLPGIIAEVTSIIADSKISIKQIVVGYPELLEEEHLFIITEKSLPGRLIPEIRAIKGVKRLSIH